MSMTFPVRIDAVDAMQNEKKLLVCSDEERTSKLQF